MKDEKGQGQVKRKEGRSKEEEEQVVKKLLPFALLLSSSLILYPSSLHLRVDHHRIRQDMQAFLLVPDLGQLSTVGHALHHGSHFG